MPKAILEFQLPEESHEFNNSINGSKYISTLQDIDNFLRNKLKHEELSEEVYKALDLVRSELHETASQHGFNIWANI